MLKKMLGSLLVVALLVGAGGSFAGVAEAAVDPSTEAVSVVDSFNSLTTGDVSMEAAALKGLGGKVKGMEGYDEWYQMLQEAKAMLAENKALRNQLRAAITGMTKEERAAIKEYMLAKKTELIALRDEHRDLVAQQKENWSAFRSAALTNDTEEMQDTFDEIVIVRSEKNQVIESTNQLLQEILDYVS